MSDTMVTCAQAEVIVLVLIYCNRAYRWNHHGKYVAVNFLCLRHQHIPDDVHVINCEIFYLCTSGILPTQFNSPALFLYLSFYPCWPLVLCCTTTPVRSYWQLFKTTLSVLFLSQLCRHCVWLCQLPKDHLWTWGLRDRFLLPLQTAVASQPDVWHGTATAGPAPPAEELQVLVPQLQPRERSRR